MSADTPMVDPRDGPALHARGVLFCREGRLREGIGCFRQAVEVSPQLSGAWNDLACAYAELGEDENAVRAWDTAIALRGNNAELCNSRGAAMARLKRGEEALASFDRALESNPYHAAAWSNRAAALLELGRSREAIESSERALSIRPGYAQAHNNRGNALNVEERYDEALRCFDRALELAPALAEAWSNRARALTGLARPDEALASAERAIALAPASVQAHLNRGLALVDLQRHPEALGSFERAVALDPASLQAHVNRGSGLTYLRRHAEAIESFDRALQIRPADATALHNRALSRLLLGDLPDGWRDYEHRWGSAGFEPARHASRPRWSASSPRAGRRVLLWSEQGLGDTLHFCRYAPMVEALGADVVLEVQPALKAVLQTLRGVSQVVAQGEPQPACDAQAPLLSLPLAFGTQLAAIPAPIPYLHADPAKSQASKRRLGAPRTRRIGLACSGGTAYRNDASRSIPLRLLRPLFDRAELFLLQKEVRGTDEADLATSGIRDVRQELNDFADTAALIECMDLVVSVDTAVAHLAGAMGRPVWILLPWAPDWRWMLDRDDSPWYPTAKLFRQTRAGDWDGVIDRVAAAI